MAQSISRQQKASLSTIKKKVQLLRGKYKGRGLMKAFLAEKKREKEL